jgi:hypothetical protein
MPEAFIEVASKTTKQKQMVPAHYLDHPVLGKNFEPTAAGREQLRVNAGPSEDWTVAQLQEAAGGAGLGLRTKAELLEAISAAEHSPHVGDPQTGSTGPGGVPVDAEHPESSTPTSTDSTTTDPAAGNKE